MSNFSLRKFYGRCNCISIDYFATMSTINNCSSKIMILCFCSRLIQLHFYSAVEFSQLNGRSKIARWCAARNVLKQRIHLYLFSFMLYTVTEFLLNSHACKRCALSHVMVRQFIFSLLLLVARSVIGLQRRGNRICNI